MGNKMTPLQMLVGFLASIVVIFAMTAASWKWPDRPFWVSLLELFVLVSVSAILIYIVARKTNPTD
jgi:hypothetical protein